MKRFFSTLLAVFLFLSLSCPALAFEHEGLEMSVHHGAQDKEMDCCEPHEEFVTNSDAILCDEEFKFDDFDGDGLVTFNYFQKCFNWRFDFKHPIRGPASLGPKLVGVTVKHE